MVSQSGQMANILCTMYIKLKTHNTNTMVSMIIFLVPNSLHEKNETAKDVFSTG